MNYVKPNIETLPYELAFRKFKLANGISLSKISFFEQSKIQLIFDNLYKFK